MLGILYTMLVEKVFKQYVSNGCKRKLAHLQDSDVSTIVKFSPGQEKYTQNDTRTYSILGRFGVDMAIAMSWTMYHNAVLSVHKWQKDGENALCCEHVYVYVENSKVVGAFIGQYTFLCFKVLLIFQESPFSPEI